MRLDDLLSINAEVLILNFIIHCKSLVVRECKTYFSRLSDWNYDCVILNVVQYIEVSKLYLKEKHNLLLDIIHYFSCDDLFLVSLFWWFVSLVICISYDLHFCPKYLLTYSMLGTSDGARLCDVRIKQNLMFLTCLDIYRTLYIYLVLPKTITIYRTIEWFRDIYREKRFQKQNLEVAHTLHKQSKDNNALQLK